MCEPVRRIWHRQIQQRSQSFSKLNDFINSKQNTVTSPKPFKIRAARADSQEPQRALSPGPSSGNSNKKNKNKHLQYRKRSHSLESGLPTLSHLKNIEPLQGVPYVKQDPVRFFMIPFSIVPTPGFRVTVADDVKIYDPIKGVGEIHQIQIRKVFASNAKPLLMDCFIKDENGHPLLSSHIILKKGDDLRKDAGVLFMFRFMNSIWRDNNLNFQGYAVRTLTYQCISIAPDFGAIELIPNCKTLKEIRTFASGFQHEHRCNLVSSAAGSYIASYIMGIRDRHYDNVLIRSDGTLFHIDFGYVLGETLGGLDTSKLAITSELKQLMGEQWDQFVIISGMAFKQLRNHFTEFVQFAKIVFGFWFESEHQLEEFLHERFRMDLSEWDAGRYIRKKLEKAPTKVRTKLKNAAHAFVQSIV